MNKSFTLFFLFIFTLFLNNAIRAACPAGNVTLHNQNAVDNFAITYPGCTTLPAGVKLRVKGANITNLNGLSVLTQIDGKLEIEWCPALVDITGLSNITTVNGELQLEECHALTSLNGLQNLASCHDLELKGMNALTDISQLSGLTSLSGDLQIKDCDMLTDLTGLENITSVGGDLRIHENENLTDLSALSNITSVGGNVHILGNKYLTSLNGLDNITSIGGDLNIEDNPSLTDCIGACKMVDAIVPPGTLTLNNNNSLQCNDEATLIADCLVALPVELTNFKGYAMDRSNMLKWQTESEENSLAFLVERSLDGRSDFVEIGRINAAGNSTALINYELEDLNPVSLAYYRLRIVDFDGTYEFSDVIAVERSKTQIDLVEIYPNPVEEEVTVLVHAKTSGKAIMTLSDFLGRKIKEEKVELKAGINHYTIEFGEHETNFYYLTIYDGTERIAKKILRASKD